MKTSQYITTLGMLLLSYFCIDMVSAGVINIPQSEIIKTVSIDKTPVANGNIVTEINSLGFSLLTLLKVVLQGLIVIYIVYIGATMVMSMGTDEDKLSKSKSQLRYTLLAFLFINIPGTLYRVFQPKENPEFDEGQMLNSEFTNPDSEGNMLVNLDQFGLKDGTLSDIASFLEYFILGIAVFMIVIAGVNIMTSRGREEKITEAKNKILYSLFALIFVGLIEAWIRMIQGGNLQNSAFVFGSIVNLALFLAGPIALFFLTLAGYYYITSNGEEERVKKAKSIIVNTLIGCLLLVVMMTFLVDLNTLTF